MSVESDLRAEVEALRALVRTKDATIGVLVRSNDALRTRVPVKECDHGCPLCNPAASEVHVLRLDDLTPRPPG